MCEIVNNCCYFINVNYEAVMDHFKRLLQLLGHFDTTGIQLSDWFFEKHPFYLYLNSTGNIFFLDWPNLYQANKY